MKNKQTAAKVQRKPKATAPKTKTLAEMLKEQQQASSSYRVSIPVRNLLEFDPQNPQTETMTIMGQPRQIVKWNIKIDGKAAIANFMVGQVGRLYQSIVEENLPEGVSLDDKEQAVVVYTERFTTNQRGVKTPNGNLGFLNLTPFTVKNSAAVEIISGFQFAE